MNTWKRTAATVPGHYFFRDEADPNGPDQIVQVWPLSYGLTHEMRYGWQVPPADCPACLAMRMHDEEAIEADALIGLFWCDEQGVPVPLLPPLPPLAAVKEPDPPRKKKAPSRKKAAKKKEPEEKKP